jgi:hypothetical protein
VLLGTEVHKTREALKEGLLGTEAEAAYQVLVRISAK